jgi:thiol-disulfide isomerase/thioredoxin
MQNNLRTNIVLAMSAITIGALIYWALLTPNITSTEPAKSSGSDLLFASTLLDANDTSQALTQYRGKTLVINFWATWCPPCREEMPELSLLHTEFESQNVVVIGIAIDNSEAVNTFLKEAPVSYPVLLAEDEGMGIGDSLGNDKGVLPYTIIIDSSGQIRNRFFGRITQTLLAEHLNELSL